MYINCICITYISYTCYVHQIYMYYVLLIYYVHLTRMYRRLKDLTTHTSLSPIRRGFAPGFVNYKKSASASDKVYQLLAHGRWFSPGTPASSTTKTDSHDIAEILLKVALNTKNQISYVPLVYHVSFMYIEISCTFVLQ